MHFPPKASRPGRFVAATACQGRHETPGTSNPFRSSVDPHVVASASVGVRREARIAG